MRKSASIFRRGATNISVLLGTVIFLVLAAEAGSRLMYPQWPFIWSQGFLHHDRSLGTYVGRPGYQGRMANIYDEFDVPLMLDRRGFRNPQGHGPKSAALLCFGDSFGFGWGVGADDVLCTRVASPLGVPSYNLAMPATDLSDYLLLQRAFGKKTGARIVLVLVTFENDVLSYGAIDSIIANRKQPRPNRAFKWMIENSAFCSVAAAVLQRSPFFVRLARSLGFLAPSGASIDGTRDPVAASLDIIDVMRKEAGPDTRFTVALVPPRPRTGLAGAYEDFAGRLRARGIETIAPKPTDGDFFPNDGHWTAHAHGRAAAMVVKALSDRPSGVPTPGRGN